MLHVSECQTVWILVGPDLDQQTTLVSKELISRENIQSIRRLVIVGHTSHLGFNKPYSSSSGNVMHFALKT